MEARLKTLERIAALALQVRTLERELIPATNARLVIDRLKQARQDLDAELAELAVLDREEWKRQKEVTPDLAGVSDRSALEV